MQQQVPGHATAEGALGFGADAAAMVALVHRAMGLHQAGDFTGAAALYREVLVRYPDHADVLHYLGMAEYKLGRCEEARALFHRSIALDGSKAMVHINLGRTHLNEGDHDAAAGHFRRAVATAPNDWESAHMLGRALLAGDHAYEAVTNLERAATLRPDSTPVLLDLAHGYAACRRHPKAAETCRKILRRDSDNAAALGGLSFSLRAMNDSREALECLRRATAIDPADVRWQCELGALLEEMGEFDEAIATLDKVLSERPQHPLAVAQLLALRQGGQRSALVDAAVRQADSDGVIKPVRVQLHFALGRHYDAAGEYDRAFRHFTAANDIVALGRRYRPLAMEAEVDSQVEAFPRSLLETMRSFGSPSERPVFIVGMPRSGTTLTEQILASHRDVAGAGELGYFHYLEYTLSGKGAVLDGPRLYAQDLDRATLSRSAADYLAQLSVVSPAAQRVVDKMPMNFLQLGLIALVFPAARIIHCQRDPLDTCLSCYFENFHEDQRYSTRLGSLGHYYRQYDRMMRHWRTVLGERILDVVYEDTVADIEGQARRIVAFCGLDWDENCLAFHRTARAVSTPSRWQVRQPIYRSSVGRWRNYVRHLGPLREALSPGPAA